MAQEHPEGVADLVRGFVDIPKPMSLINDCEVPCNLSNVWFFRTGKLVGADDDLRAVKRVQVPLSNLLIECFGFQQHRGKEELVRKLLMPLFPQTRGDDDENLPLPFSPSLGQEDACF